MYLRSIISWAIVYKKSIVSDIKDADKFVSGDKTFAERKVDAEMEQLREQIKQLRIQKENGHSVDQDIEACIGYMKVLKKEQDSIKEGSHSTFLTAKKYISPKFNYGSKREEILAKIKQLAKKVRDFEKQLTGAGLEQEQRTLLTDRLEELRDLHKNALLELKALENYNHTRFLESTGQKDKKPKKIYPVFAKKKKNQEELPQPKAPAPERKESGDAIDFNPPPMI